MTLIKVLGAGGTIATTADATTGRSRANRSIGVLARELGGQLGLEIDVEDIMTQPSWVLGPRDMQQIALRAHEAASTPRYAGVVVTHGTTTLEYTAFLTDLLLEHDTPVIFTGAMRRADASDPDGPTNVRDALRIAASPTSRSHGVLVAFNGRILSARGAWKRHRSMVDAFVDLYGQVGRVDEAGITIERRPLRPRSFPGHFVSAVAIVKAYPGANGEAIEAAIRHGSQGIVVEGLPGAGGIPPTMQPALRNATKRGIAIVMASRAPEGHVPARPTGGTGEPLLDLPLVSAHDLTSEKAWVLLMVALAEARNLTHLRDIFDAMAMPESTT